jgi:hypothetical protein
MTKRGLMGLTSILAVAIAGGCNSAAKPVADTKNSPSASPSASVAPSYQPGTAITVSWADSDFASSGCPDNHATATACYSGSASGTLPVIGQVDLHRVVYTTGSDDAQGCSVADTDGTLTKPGGVLTFHATGTLCGLLATYRVTTSSGTGSLAGVTIDATITNSSGAESWSGTVTRS